MHLLSAKRSRPLIRRENSLRTALWRTIHWPIILFGSMVEDHPISAKGQSRLHQFREKVFPGIFIGYVLYAGGIWKGGTLVADVEKLDNLDASEIHARRTNAKVVLIPKKGEEIVCLFEDESVKLSGRDQVFRKSIFNSGPSCTTNSTTLFFKENHTDLNDQKMISGVVLGTIFIVIMFNQELNSTCQKEGRSLYDSNILTLSGGQIRHWMCCWKSNRRLLKCGR